MSALQGVSPAVVAIGAAAVGAGVTHAYHSGGGSRGPSRRRSSRVTLVDRTQWSRARRGADAVAEGAEADVDASGAAFPSSSRAAARGYVVDADGRAVYVGDPGYGAGALLLTGAASAALALAVARALSARDGDRSRDDTHDESNASNTGPGAAEACPKPPSHPASRLANLRAKTGSARAAGARAGFDAVARELRVLMEESPLQSPLDSSFDISAISSTETSPFATPAREALSALRHTAKAAAQAGAPFSERALKEAEALVRSAEERAVASVSGGNTPKAKTLHLPPVDEADEAAGRERESSAAAAAAAAERKAEMEATRARGNATETTSRPMASVRPPDTPGRDAEESAMATANKENDAVRVLEAETKKDDDADADATTTPAAAAAADGKPTPAAASSSSSSAERVRRAEDRYHRARERLRMASAVSGSSAEASSSRGVDFARGRGDDEGACRSDAATASWGTTRTGGESVSGRAGDSPSPRESASMLEMAAKVEAALARSRLAQERIQAAAREAVREANEAAAKVREDWAKAPSSRASWSNRSGSERGGSTRGDRTQAANPARRWAFGDEVKGKTDVFDRFMGSLSAIKLAREQVEGTERVDDGEGAEGAEFPESAPTGVDTSFDDLIDEEGAAAAAAADRDDEGASAGSRAAPTAGTLGTLGTLPRDAIDGTFPRKEHAEGPRLGALRVRLIGDAREGETLTLRVDSAAVPEGCGPLTLRWERGCARDGEGERSDAREDFSPATAFRTILGAKGASYTCTSADVGCVVRAVAAADGGAPGGGSSVLGSAQTDARVVARM